MDLVLMSVQMTFFKLFTSQNTRACDSINRDGTRFIYASSAKYGGLPPEIGDSDLGPVINSQNP